MLRFAAALLCLMIISPAGATEAGWALLREGGQTVLIRHAISPGSSDSRGFAIEDCATQRNLSERGKQQAKRMGALFATRADRVERVLSSRFCRCLETASLAFEYDKVEPYEPLDLLPEDPTAAKAANEAVLAEIRDYSGTGNLVMVTHLENIHALTGQSPREGEALIVRPEGDTLKVIGRIVFN